MKNSVQLNKTKCANSLKTTTYQNWFKRTILNLSSLIYVFKIESGVKNFLTKKTHPQTSFTGEACQIRKAEIIPILTQTLSEHRGGATS